MTVGRVAVRDHARHGRPPRQGGGARARPARGAATSRGAGRCRRASSCRSAPVTAEFVGARPGRRAPSTTTCSPSRPHAAPSIVVGPVRSVRGDPFGLARRSVRWTRPVELFVHPLLVSLAGASSGLLRDLEGQATRDLSDSDLSFHALRDYVAGRRPPLHPLADDRAPRQPHGQAVRGHPAHADRARAGDRPAGLRRRRRVRAGRLGRRLDRGADHPRGARARRARRARDRCGWRRLRCCSTTAPGCSSHPSGAGMALLGRRVAREAPEASVAMLVTGSVPTTADLRLGVAPRARPGRGPSSCAASAARTCRCARHGTLSLATLGDARRPAPAAAAGDGVTAPARPRALRPGVVDAVVLLGAARRSPCCRCSSVYGDQAAVPALAGGLVLGARRRGRGRVAPLVGADRRRGARRRVLRGRRAAGRALDDGRPACCRRSSTVDALARGRRRRRGSRCSRSSRRSARAGRLLVAMFTARVRRARPSAVAVALRCAPACGRARRPPSCRSSPSSARSCSARGPRRSRRSSTGTVLAVVLLPWAAWRSGALRARRVVSPRPCCSWSRSRPGSFGAPAVVGVVGPARGARRDRAAVRPARLPEPAVGVPGVRQAGRGHAAVHGLRACRRAPGSGSRRWTGTTASSGTSPATAPREASGEFRRVGDVIETSARGDAGARDDRRSTTSSGVWLPTVGQATSFDVTDPAAANGLRYNDATGAAVVTERRAPGPDLRRRRRRAARSHGPRDGRSGAARRTSRSRR